MSKRPTLPRICTLLSVFLLSLLLLAFCLVMPVQAATASDVSLPTLLWQTHFSYSPDVKVSVCTWSSPVVVNGIVYVSSRTIVNFVPNIGVPGAWGDIYAFNATTGGLIWDYRDNSTIIFGSLAVENGRIFFGAYGYSSTHVGALDASNGVSLWNYTISGVGWVIGSPVVVNGTLYIGANNGQEGGVFALNAANGEKNWDYPINGRAGIGLVSVNVIVNSIVYVTSGLDNDTYALKASNGERLWNYASGGDSSSPVVANGLVYVGSADGNLRALNASDGTRLWNYTVGKRLTSPAVVNNMVYTLTVDPNFTWNGQNNYTLYALKASNGAKIWNSFLSTSGGGLSAPIMYGGVIYLLGKDSIYALNAYNGEKLWTLTGFTPNDMLLTYSLAVAVTNGVIYLGSGNGQFYAYSVSSIPIPKPKSPQSEGIRATTNDGSTIDLIISGNITSSQMSNVTFTTDESVTSANLSFNVIRENGTTGFSNITIPKTAIPYGTTPTIYFDNQKAEDQGYTQDGDNYYVWYTTDFGTHQISITFVGSQNPESSSTETEFPSYIVWLGAVFAVIIIGTAVTVVYVRKKKIQRKPNHLYDK